LAEKFLPVIWLAAIWLAVIWLAGRLDPPVFSLSGILARFTLVTREFKRPL
jgi:hypothetical protein